MNDNDEIILKKLEAMSLQMSGFKEISVHADENDFEQKQGKQKLLKSAINSDYFLELPGNKIETKRIDLRSNKEKDAAFQQSKKVDLFKEILQNTSDSPLEADMKSLHKMLNNGSIKKFYEKESEHSSSSSSSSSSSEDEEKTNGDSLWIGRYRRAKMEFLKKK